MLINLPLPRHVGLLSFFLTLLCAILKFIVKNPVNSSAGIPGSNSADFSVVISATARSSARAGHSSTESASRLVHAVSVSQPVQSWTVIRDHVDFIALGNALASIIHGLPQCPIPPTIDFSSGEDHIVNARNVLQDWLTSVLFVPGARENPAVRQFLCYGANIVPPQFEGVSWISFTSTRGEGCHQGDQGRSLETEKGTMQQNVELSFQELLCA